MTDAALGKKGARQAPEKTAWILAPEEHIPRAPGKGSRAWRQARALAQSGWNVTLFTNDFDHRAKCAILGSEQGIYEDVARAEGFRVDWLRSTPYKRNISFARWRNHHRYGRLWLNAVESKRRPDIILASLPSHLLAAAATKWGREHEVPVVVDVRDAWPLFFIYVVPPVMRRAARRLLGSDFRAAQDALAKATHVIAVSESYLNWARRDGARPMQRNDQVFYLGAETAGTQMKSRPEAVSPVIVLFAGTLGKYSDPGLCIRMAELALERGLADEFIFQVAGDGPKRELVVKAAERLPNLRFLGWLEADALDDAINGSHLCVVPRPATPHPEGLAQLPNKFFGYLSHGKAILTDEEGEVGALTSEWNCGFVVEQGSAHDALSAVESYLKLDKRERLALAENARQAFEAFGRADAIDAGFAEYMHQLVDGK